MTQIFEAIRNFFGTIGITIKLVISLLVKVFSLLGSMVTYVGRIFACFPGWIYAVVVILIVVCVIYKVLGREGNS